MSDLITITRWASLTNPHGKRFETTWEQWFRVLSSPQAIGLVPSAKKGREGRLDPDKERLPGWSAGTFAGDMRKKAACKNMCALVLDYDGGATLAAAIELWSPHRGFIHTTPSHQHDGQGDRFRVVLPFNRAVTPTEYAKLWAWANDKALNAGHTIDASAKDPSRLWFMPAVIVEGAK